MEKVEFVRISTNEVKFQYKGVKFILEEKPQGVYSMGKGVILYELNGLEKRYLKTIGWTKSDNYRGERDDEHLLNGLVRFDDCKEPALNYVKSLMD